MVKDVPQAMRWLRLSAEQGYPMAQHNLGIVYAAGEDVPRDYAQAYKWFSLAVVQGVKQSEAPLAELERQMTRQEFELSRKALEEFTPNPSKITSAALQ